MPLTTTCHQQTTQSQSHLTTHDKDNSNQAKDASFQTPPQSRQGSHTTARTLEQAFPAQTSNNKNMDSTTAMNSQQEEQEQRKISPMPFADDDDQDYLLFVQSLGQEEDPMMNLASLVVEEEEEDFVLTDLDDDDDDDEDDDDDDELLGLASLGQAISPSSPGNHHTTTTTTEAASMPSPSPLLLENSDFYSQLEAELGSLLEEDLEAAVSTLLAGSSTLDPSSKQRTSLSNTQPLHIPNESSPTSLKTPTEPPHAVTRAQVEELQQLLQSHYQLLVQSSVLAVRAARKEFPEESPLVFHQGETPEELTMTVLDGAVGMLQDLNQCRKDAIRNYIQRCETSPPAQKSLFWTAGTNKRLTRSAFSSLQESTNAHTIFDVDGLYQLKQTFRTIDNCGTQREGLDILEPIQHWDACRQLLEQAGAKIDESLLPGKVDLSQIVSNANEVFGPDFVPPTSIPQQIVLRRNRNQFTAAEDNLILRGVNLYGEKQWILIADRFLPDRSVNIISQRYSKICVLLYKAHGVEIDANGNLPTPPRFDKVDQLDQQAISKIKPATPPAVFNVHRWSLEEDVTLLKSVPLLGNQWAELSNRIIPHRDRGHLRKRYQVLERRIKATVTRSKRSEAAMLPRTTPILVSTQRPPVTKTTVLSRKRKGGPVKPPALPLNGSIIRGPGVPAHLLCPSNGKGGKNKPVRKTMEFAARRTSPTAKRPLPTNGKSNTNGTGGYVSQPSGPVNGGYASRSGAPAPQPAASNGGYPNYPGASTQPNGGYPYHPGAPPTNMGYMHHPGAPPPPGNYSNHPGGPPPATYNYAPANGGYATSPRASPGGYATSQASPHANASYSNHWDNGSSHEASRFETLLTGATDDWSQLSRMQRMMDNEKESMAASAIKSLAMGTRDLPPPQNLERLPQIEIHSSSGLSILNDNKKRDDKSEPQNDNASSSAEKGSATPPAKQRNGSILASVLERTRKDDVQENATEQENSVNKEAPAAKVPSTPSRPPPNLSQSPDYGTPLGVSPGAGLHMRTFYSPGGHKNGASPGFKASFSPPPFHSPGPMHSLMGGPGNSNDYSEMYPFDITEKSRQAFGEGSNHAPEPLTPSAGVFHEHHDLKATDLDAISALNSLSNSPAKFPMQRPATNEDDEEKGKKDTTKQSLFAAAIGAVEQKEAGRKKRRTK